MLNFLGLFLDSPRTELWTVIGPSVLFFSVVAEK